MNKKANSKFFVLKNKKAGEKYLSIWMFVIWVMIGVAIVLGVFTFYSVQGDVRMEEAEILNLKLINCLIDSGELDEIFLNPNTDVAEKCKINKDLFGTDLTCFA